MRNNIVSHTLGAYPSMTRYSINGWKKFTRKANMVGVQTFPGSDINTDECNNPRNGIPHTYILNLIRNIHKTYIPDSHGCIHVGRAIPPPK